MARPLANPENLGYFQYRLGKNPEITVMSRKISLLLGVSAPMDAKAYASHIHGEEREKYCAGILRLSKAPGTEELSYRLIDSRGRVCRITENAVSWQEADGSLAGESVIVQKSPEDENHISFGVLRCSGDKQPQITGMNAAFRKMLRIPPTAEGEADYEELYRKNALLMLPMEQRRRFLQYFRRISTENVPMFGETSLIRCDGTRVRVFGWITKEQGQNHSEELQAVCLDVTDYYVSRKTHSTRRYLSALSDVYDKIFQYNLEEGILKCLYVSGQSRFRWLRDIPMQMEETTEKWVHETVVPEQQEQVLRFFRNHCRKGTPGETGPSRITYRARSTSGEIRKYSGIFLSIDENTTLYCCRCVQNPRENELLRTENDSLKENMQELMMRFTDGIAGFQIADGAVTPLYVTDNICSFFGRTREEWLPLMQKATPIRDFVSQSPVDYEKFEKLLQDGEAEFTYLDLKTHTEKRMRAICSHKTPCEGVPRYVMLYQEAPEQQASTPHVYVRTFGYFDVFVDEAPIAFRNQKSKELLAFLIDRQGGFVSSQEAIGYLWEDEPVSTVTLARFRKVAMRLKNILMEYGISEIVESVDGKHRVIPQRLRCDLYDYLSGKEEYAALFKGSYLTNYSWGEITLAELSGTTLY